MGLTQPSTLSMQDQRVEREWKDIMEMISGCGQKAELHRTHLAVLFSSQSAKSGQWAILELNGRE